MKRVYIMHPLVGDGSPAWSDQARNVERYLQFCALASDRGNVVLSWVHHYMMHVRGLTCGNAEYYLTRDRSLLQLADEAWLCGPPEVSAGIRYELECCREFSVPIVEESGWCDFTFLPRNVCRCFRGTS